MKALLLAFVTAGALTFGLLPMAASAQQIHLGVNLGDGYGGGDNNGYNHHHGQWHHVRHHRHHCQTVQIWRHHHPVWVQQCGW